MKEECLFIESCSFIDNLYYCFLKDPASLNKEWQEFFSSLTKDDLLEDNNDFYHFKKNEQKKIYFSQSTTDRCIDEIYLKYIVLLYRKYGFLYSKINPIETKKQKVFYEEILSNQIPFDQKINCSGYLDLQVVSALELFHKLEYIYCGLLTLEIGNLSINKTEFLASEFEKKWSFSKEEKIFFYSFLSRVKYLEEFLHYNFLGAKRFSSEGLESFLLALEMIIIKSAKKKYSDVVIGMAHRGRIAALRELTNKDLFNIFIEFDHYSPISISSWIAGDVKYHNGFENIRIIDNNKIKVSILNTPSHLESINGVVMGNVRAKQDKSLQKKEGIIGVLVHGDAAVSGQGVVAESLILSELKAYDGMGIIHIIANNQLGFTANIEETRLTAQPSSFAYLGDMPILHVNADYPEHVCRAVEIAFLFRSVFKSGIIINIIGYRKYGHNESDEPRFTQPLMYKIIDKKLSTLDFYAQFLIENGLLSKDEIKKDKAQYNEIMKKSLDSIKNNHNYKTAPFNQWGDYILKDSNDNVSTGVSVDFLKEALIKGSELPTDFNCNSRIEKFFKIRKNSIDNGVSWINAEFLAFASLLSEGYGIRLAGQDSKRGTFSQRHAIIIDSVNEKEYTPLKYFKKNKNVILGIYNSPLSEYAAMAFEYGYSIYARNTLVIWEAQFGDFANGAQIVIDQYISSGESKWLQSSGLVLLLPHGYEGQGSEHSSARIERFLQLCANNNMCIVNCTTPANYFHILRYQLLSKYRKPLIIFSPKSLLRHKMAVSFLKDIEQGTYFEPVIVRKVENPKKLVLCSGKFYYDLLQKILDTGISNIEIIRLEQIYPFPEHKIKFDRYQNVDYFIWTQEEPRNMGSWSFVKEYINKLLVKHGIRKKFEYIGRSAMSTPASGYAVHHTEMQEIIINKILNR